MTSDSLHKSSAKTGGKIVGDAQVQWEKESGKLVVSQKNHVDRLIFISKKEHLLE